MFHFLPISERYLNFKCLVLLHLLNNMFRIHGFRNPSPKFHGFYGTHVTHANTATVSEMDVKLYFPTSSFLCFLLNPLRVHPYEMVQFGDAKLQFLGGFAVLETRWHSEKIYFHGQNVGSTFGVLIFLALRKLNSIRKIFWST